MSTAFKLLKEERICPPGVQGGTFHLSPLDLYCLNSPFFLSWPFFFDYDVDANRLKEALEKLSVKYPILCGRVVPDADTCYSIEVNPKDPQAFGFPFFELQSDMTIASAILTHGKITAPHANFPVLPDLPFFVGTVDTTAVLSGETAPARARLTHFKDGCAVTILVSHMLMDGQRLIELNRDLGRAYRGEEIPDRCHDRSYLWPDQLAKHFTFLGDDIAKLPRKLQSEMELPSFVHFPDDSFFLEALYFSKETLEDMKAKVKPFLTDGQFVSSNDVLVAFNWMLSTEIYKERTQPVANGSDLEISNTMTSMTIEYLKNGVELFPENYCGNGYGYHMASLEGHDIEGKSLGETFAELSLIVRKGVTDFRTQPQIALNAALVYYLVASTGKLPVDLTVFRGGITSMVKTPTTEVDFGGGSSKMAYVIGPAPCLGGGVAAAAPGPGKGEGIMVHLQITEKQRSRIKSSSVVRECAPGLKLLFSDFSEDEFRTLLDMK